MHRADLIALPSCISANRDKAQKRNPQHCLWQIRFFPGRRLSKRTNPHQHNLQEIHYTGVLGLHIKWIVFSARVTRQPAHTNFLAVPCCARTNKESSKIMSKSYNKHHKTTRSLTANIHFTAIILHVARLLFPPPPTPTQYLSRNFKICNNTSRSRGYAS